MKKSSMKAYGKFMAKIAVIGIGIYLFCQSAAFWGELLYSKNKIQFCLEQSIDGREAAELLKRDEEFTKESGYEKPEAKYPLDRKSVV